MGLIWSRQDPGGHHIGLTLLSGYGLYLSVCDLLSSYLVTDTNELKLKEAEVNGVK